MVMLHAFGALAGGFALTLLLTALFELALKRFAPEWAMGQNRPGIRAVAASLVWSLASAAAGGYTTAWLGTSSPLWHALALAIVLLTLGALSALQERQRLPITVLALLVAAPPAGVMAGALLRLVVLGLL